MKRTTACVLMMVLVMGAFTGASVLGKDTQVVTQALSESKREELTTQGLEIVAENDALALYADSTSGNTALYRKKTEIWWYSNPAEYMGKKPVGQEPVLTASHLEITYYDSQFLQVEAGSLVGVVNKNGLSSSRIENGVRFEYNFVQQGITIGLEYRLNNDYLEVSVPIESVKEQGDYTLGDISLLPFFGSSSAKDKGYIFVPDGSGALIDFQNSTNSTYAYSQPVYGNDRTMTKTKVNYNSEAARLPVLGIHREQNGLICVADKGDGLAKVNAQLASMKKKRNMGYFSFSYRPSDWMTLNSADRNARDVVAFAKQPASIDAFAVRYYPLDGEGTYFDMAARYRKYLEDERGLTPSGLKTDIEPFVVTSYGAIKKKGHFLWIPTDVTVPLTSYNGLENILSELSDEGIENIMVDYRGWYKGGYTAAPPVKGKIEKELGSKKDLKKLLNTAKNNGSQIFAGVNLTDLYNTGIGYSRSSSVARTVSGAPALQYRYRLDSGYQDTKVTPWYLLSPRKYSDLIEKFSSSYKQYDFNGLSLGNAGGTLLSDFKTEDGDRLGIQPHYIAAFEAAASKGMVMAEDVNAFLLPYIDFVLGAPAEHSGFDIESTRVPFYQLVLSGFMQYSLPPVNLGASADTMFLYAVETGSSLHYIFNDENIDQTKDTVLESIYNSNFREWLPEAAMRYQALAEVRKKTGTRIVNHTQLAQGVAEVTWENGMVVVVNYTKNVYDFNKKSKVQPLSYSVFEKGETK